LIAAGANWREKEWKQKKDFERKISMHYVYLMIAQSDWKKNLEAKKDFERKKNHLIDDSFFWLDYVYLMIADFDWWEKFLTGKRIYGIMSCPKRLPNGLKNVECPYKTCRNYESLTKRQPK